MCNFGYTEVFVKKGIKPKKRGNQKKKEISCERSQ